MIADNLGSKNLHAPGDPDKVEVREVGRRGVAGTTLGQDRSEFLTSDQNRIRIVLTWVVYRPSDAQILPELGVASVANFQTSFQVDPGTAEAIDELKGVFGVTSNTAVIRKAIALARVAARNSHAEDRTVTLVGKDGLPLKISLAG